MLSSGEKPEKHALEKSPPIFNVPVAVLSMLGLFFGVHVVREFLSVEADWQFLLTFAFIPQRIAILFDGQQSLLQGGYLANIWTFFTYMFLHGDWSHLVFNSLWMLAFASPLAFRIGSGRFVIFSLIMAAAGAGLHLYMYWGEIVPVIGASAAVSGQMAAVMRFALSGNSTFSFGAEGRERFLQPAESLLGALCNPRLLMFIAVWLGMNYIFGVGIIDISGAGAQIAWEAHLGGFIAGFLLFPLFDPVKPAANRA